MYYYNTFSEILQELVIPFLWSLFGYTVLSVVFFLAILLKAAYLTLFERVTLAAIQRRAGPHVVGFLGLLQPIADALKLMLKERTVPSVANSAIFLLSAIFVFWISLLGWVVLPLGGEFYFLDTNCGFLYFMAISGVSVYGVIVAGWSSRSRYSFLGALRACAQMLSYELTITLILTIFFFQVGSLNVLDIVAYTESAHIWRVWYLPLFVVWLISALAETYRAPFDLAEAESELVSGFNVEYSSMVFAYLFLGEYIHILIMSHLAVILFMGAWYPPEIINVLLPSIYTTLANSLFFSFINYSIKVIFVVFIFIWIRATFPRFRYDQLMSFGWKVLLPITFMFYIYIIFCTFAMEAIIPPVILIIIGIMAATLLGVVGFCYYSTRVTYWSSFTYYYHSISIDFYSFILKCLYT